MRDLIRKYGLAGRGRQLRDVAGVRDRDGPGLRRDAGLQAERALPAARPRLPHPHDHPRPHRCARAACVLICQGWGYHRAERALSAAQPRLPHPHDHPQPHRCARTACSLVCQDCSSGLLFKSIWSRVWGDTAGFTASEWLEGQGVQLLDWIFLDIEKIAPKPLSRQRKRSYLAAMHLTRALQHMPRKCWGRVQPFPRVRVEEHGGALLAVRAC